MTVRMVRWLQHGRSASFALLIGLTSVLAVLLAVARERSTHDFGPPAARRSSLSRMGAMPLADGLSRRGHDVAKP